MMSLRLKLLSSIIFVSLAAWGGAAFKSYRDTRAEVDRLFDAHLSESAAALLNQAAHEWREQDLRQSSESDHEDDSDAGTDDDYGVSQLRERGDLLEKRLVFEFRDANNALILRSGKELKGASVPEGFSEVKDGPVALRTFSQWNHDRTLRVIVAESVDARVALANVAVGNIVQPILWVILPLVLILAFFIEWMLKPLRKISAEVSARSVDDLKMLDTTGAPAELTPIIDSLNSLFTRLDRAIQHERRFTADAAHELRTPLAAIKVQAQVALKETSESARGRAIEAIVAGVDRATHLVEQLLTLARLDPETTILPDAVALRSLATEVVQEIAPMAIAKALTIDIAPGNELQIAGQRPLLKILIRNLLDNAVRYSPAGGRVQVGVKKTHEGILLVIDDNGPGLNELQIKNLGQRFSRVARPSGEGSGLGLSIALKIATLHHAKINFINKKNGTGLLVEVVFSESSPPRNN